jgi:hypothetical protein
LDDEGYLEEGRGDPITAVTLCDPNIPTRITPPTTTPRGFNHAPMLLLRILFRNNTLSSARIFPGLQIVIVSHADLICSACAALSKLYSGYRNLGSHDVHPSGCLSRIHLVSAYFQSLTNVSFIPKKSRAPCPQSAAYKAVLVELRTNNSFEQLLTPCCLKNESWRKSLTVLFDTL